MSLLRLTCDVLPTPRSKRTFGFARDVDLGGKLGFSFGRGGRGCCILVFSDRFEISVK